MKERNCHQSLTWNFSLRAAVATAICASGWFVASCGPVSELEQETAASETEFDQAAHDKDKGQDKTKDKESKKDKDSKKDKEKDKGQDKDTQGNPPSDTDTTSASSPSAGDASAGDASAGDASAGDASAAGDASKSKDSAADNREGAHGHDQPKTAAKWYITMHGEPAGNTVHALSGEGVTLGNILDPVPASAGGPAKGVRGMLHTGQHGLLLVSANLDNTRLLRYGAPTADGMLPFNSVFASKKLTDPDLVHSYAIAVGADGTVYASNQDTDTVTRYFGIGSPHPGQPIPVPSQIEGLGLPVGTIVPRAQVSPQGITQIRGIAIGADGLLYVCDRGASQVIAFDPTTGLRKGVIADASNHLKHPIQLLFAPDGFTLYLTDNGVPAIFRMNIKTGEIILFADTKTGCPPLPSSLAMDAEHLYVGDRKKKQIIRFKLANGEVDKKPFADALPDAPEFMIPATPMPFAPLPVVAP